MNLHDVIIDRTPAEQAAVVIKRREELKPYGYSVILTKSLAELIAQARRQGSLEHAR